MPAHRRATNGLGSPTWVALTCAAALCVAATCVPLPDVSSSATNDGRVRPALVDASAARSPEAREATVRVTNPTERTVIIRTTFEIVGTQVHYWELVLEPGATGVLLGPDEADIIEVRVASVTSADPLPVIFTDFADGAVIDIVVGPDCNRNGIDDADDIAIGQSRDCNDNTIPDACEIGQDSAAGTGPFFCTDNCDPDCNGNGRPDACDIADESSGDCDGDGTPDECQLAEADCDANGVLDACELDGNDCNANGLPDPCELAGNDCNGNRIPDECEPDSNGNGIIDVCEPPPPPPPAPREIPEEPEDIVDCNRNKVDDRIDILEGLSRDQNENGVPDECESPALIGIIGRASGTPPDMNGASGNVATGPADIFISPLGEHIGFREFDLHLTEPTELLAHEVVVSGDGPDGNPAPEAPKIEAYLAGDQGRHAVRLDRAVPPGRWIRITLHVVGSRTGLDAELALWVAHLPNDINQDERVDIRDATAFGDVFRGDRNPALIDLNGDARIDVRDATEFGAQWNGNDPDQDGFPSRSWNGQRLPDRASVTVARKL